MDQSNAAYFSQEQQVVEKDKQYKIHKERETDARGKLQKII